MWSLYGDNGTTICCLGFGVRLWLQGLGSRFLVRDVCARVVWKGAKGLGVGV